MKQGMLNFTFGAFVTSALLVLTLPAFAQTPTPPAVTAPSVAPVVTPAAPTTPTPKTPKPTLSLEHFYQGAKDAKVTIIEYASMTCSHCARFHLETYAKFKQTYVDSGKVRYEFREFPLDPLAAAGSMLARCAAEEKTQDQYFAVVDLLFQQQQTWAFVDKPVDALFQTVRQAGFSQDKAEACLKRQDVYERVNASKKLGTDAGVESTPTFFINGTKHAGALRFEELEKLLKPLLKE
jgi:protein-disulfide isomerase